LQEDAEGVPCGRATRRAWSVTVLDAHKNLGGQLDRHKESKVCRPCHRADAARALLWNRQAGL